MAAWPIGSGIVAVLDDLEAGVADQVAVRRRVVVAPVHRRAEPALRVVVLGQIVGAEAEQRPAAGPEHAAHLGEDRRVVVARDVDDGVVRDDRVEARGRGTAARRDRPARARTGHEILGQDELRGREVEPDGREPAGEQAAGDGTPAPQPASRTRARRREAVEQLVEPRDVRAVVGRSAR